MRVIGQERIADVMGVVAKTIHEWQDAGFPVAAQGGANRPSEYDTEACIQWLIDREVRKVRNESPRDRNWLLQNQLLEMQLAEKQGRLVDASQLEPKLNAAIVSAREQLLRERRRLSARLQGVTDRRRCEEIIAEAHEEFLRRLATWGDCAAAEDAEP